MACTTNWEQTDESVSSAPCSAMSVKMSRFHFILSLNSLSSITAPSDTMSLYYYDFPHHTVPINSTDYNIMTRILQDKGLHGKTQWYFTCMERSSDLVTMQQKSPHAVIDNKLLKLFVCLCNQKPADSKYLMYRIEGILSLSIYVPYLDGLQQYHNLHQTKRSMGQTDGWTPIHFLTLAAYYVDCVTI